MTAAFQHARDHKILDGKAIGAELRALTRTEAGRLAEAGWAPRLVSLLVGDTAAAALYVRNQKRNAEATGIAFEERQFAAEISQAELLAAIAALNADPRVTGIILQRPLPAHLSVRALQSAIHPMKDVEGLHPASIGNIVYNDLRMGPCTSVAAVELLKRTGLGLQGLEVVVIGHSEIVGKPIAFLLMSEGATVTVCHHMTRSVAAHARRADALFVAVGKPRLIKADMVKPGAAIIDIGINVEPDGEGGARICGDVDTESVAEIASWITPVPGGVGPVTVAILLRNTMVAIARQRRHYEALYGTGDAAE